MKKENWKAHLSRRWWVYILTALAVVLLWRGAFRQALAPGAEEQLRIAYVGSGLDSDALEQELLPLVEDMGIREVLVEVIQTENDSMRSQALWARSLDADLVLVSREYLFEGIGASYFAALSMDVETWQRYTEDGILYGVFLDSESGRFGEWCSAAEDCCLSVTVNGAQRPAVLAAAQWIME